MRIGSVETYVENGVQLTASSVEVAWQYSKIYTHRKEGNDLIPLDFTDSEGKPNEKWFSWRNAAWSNPSFDFRHPDFERNKNQVRRAFPKGSIVSSWYWNGKILGPVEARREIYGTMYRKNVQKIPAYQRLASIFEEQDLIIYDLDGYDYVTLGMTPEETMRDLNHSWGHGLLISFMLQGINI